MNESKLLNRLEEVEKYLIKKEYEDTIKLARLLYERGQLVLCRNALERLPSREQLLSNLVKKLEHKSVYRTLKKIQEGRVENDITTLKGILSLGTHILIECEHGDSEYMMLMPSILEKFGEMIYDVLQ